MKLQSLFERSVSVPGKSPEGFVEYMRSPSDVKEALQTHYNALTLDNIVKLFAEHNMVIADSVTLKIKTSALYPYREYDRDPDPNKQGWTGKMEGTEYEALRGDIEQNGITHPVMMELSRLPNGNVDVKLGEGNHRLRIARELDIPHMPVNFYYRK